MKTILPLVATAASPFCLKAQEFRSFVGSNNTVWESPTNWNPNLVPDSITEGARLDNGSTVVLGSDKVIFSLEMSTGGGINFNQDNQLQTNTVVWESGGLTGPGSLRVAQAGTINAIAGATISSATFINDGTINLGRSLTLSAGAVIENRNTLSLVDGAILGTVAGGGPDIGVINNTGFLRKDNGAGNASIGSFINNINGIASTSGTLIISQGGVSSGDFVTGGGATLDLNGPWIMEDGASISGDGVTEVGGPLLLEPDATVTLDNVELVSGGGIAGSGTAILQGPDHLWSNSATLSDSSTTILSNGASATVLTTSNPFSIAGTAELIIQPGGTLKIDGSSSRLNSNGNGIIRNQGLIDITGSGDVTQNGIAPSTLLTVHNESSGILRKSGTDGTNPTLFVADLISDGVIEIEAGEIQLSRGGTINGPVNISADAKFRVNSSSTPLTMTQGSSVNGDGSFVHAGANIIIPDGATVPFDNYTTLFSSGNIAGEGTFRFSSDSLVERFHHTDPGTTEIPSGIDITGVERFDLDEGRVLQVDGSLEIISGISSTSTNGATIKNTGLITFSNASGISHGGGVFTLNNDGEIRLQAPGTGTVSLPVDNHTGDGLISITSGRLNLSRPVVTSGTIEIQSGAELRGSGVTIGPHCTVKGTGTINSSTTISGTIQPGHSLGTLSHLGSPTFTDSARLEIELEEGSSDLYDVSGTLNLGNARLVLSLDPGYIPATGSSWTVVTANSITGSFAAVEQPTIAPGFGFFITQDTQEITVTYSAIDSFEKVYAAFSGTDGTGPGINSFADDDLDGDGIRNLLEWAYGGNLSKPDSGRILSLLSITHGDPAVFTFRYPVNPLAIDVSLTMESSSNLAGPYSPITMTPSGTINENGIDYQIVTVSQTLMDSSYFRLRASIIP